MRLPLEEMLSPAQKLSGWVYRKTLGAIPGPILVVSYGKKHFGNRWTACMQEGMRKARHWSTGELELFAAFVSRLNGCPF
jgi:hypothetical protein